MSIAIIGGTGFLGAAIARALVGQGADVIQVARGQMTETPVAGARFVAADRTNAAALERLFVREGVSHAIDVMTLTLASAQPLLTAAAAKNVRYVMISAIDVTANYGGLARLETPEILQRPTREDDPRRTALYPYRHLPTKPVGIDPELLKNYDKIPIEDAAKADPGLNALILRLPAIYGPGDRQGRFTWITDALRAGGPFEIDERAANWPQSFVYIEDAAAAVARATLSDIPPQTLHIAPSGVETMGQWAQHFVDLAGHDGPVVTRPPEARALMHERADLMDMRYPLTLDGTRFEALFGPVDATDFAETIRATLIAAG